MPKGFRTSCLLILVMLVFTPDARARDVSLGLSGGAAKILGSSSDYWKVGFTLAGQGFYPVYHNSSAGLRLAYSRFQSNEDKLTETFQYPGLSWEMMGQAELIEIVPSFRTPLWASDFSRLFLQLGCGYHKVKMTVRGRAFQMGQILTIPPIAISEDKAGLEGGLGLLTHGKVKLELLLLYHVIFTAAEETKYLTITAGVVFH